MTPPPSAATGDAVRCTTHAFAGTATVLSVRAAGSAAVAVVETAEGDLVRVPVSDLAIVQTPDRSLVEGPVDPPDRFLLRLRATEVLALQQRSGMASGLRVVPMPHQVLAAHHVVDASDGRVLLADDVGMGKTIEVGLVLAVLRAREQGKRILILCPAGLRLQWQAELDDLFSLYFNVLGEQVTTRVRDLWTRYDQMIASMELLRSKANRERLFEAPPWDVVVVDEAHRVAARGVAGKTDPAARQERTQLYQLLEGLAPRTRRLLFATATPHLGRDDQFLHLLRLLRPDAIDPAQVTAPDAIDRVRPILPAIVVRTPKSMAVDWDGQRVFRGSTARTVQVPVDDEDAAFTEELLDYIERGFDAYDAALASSRNSAVLINFVMTTFLKLWTSSRPAIRAALDRRRQRIREARAKARAAEAQPARSIEQVTDEESAEALVRDLLQPGFFDDEPKLLDTLVQRLDGLGTDPKITLLMDELTRLRAQHDGGVLIFTEYVETQKAICDALSARFGADSIAFIRGGRGRLNRHAAAAFQKGTPFLVSTQAGGEGLNLQDGGHVLVNFDQPWNPLRTLQRIGRLDRFGQRAPVVVVNLVRASAIDERILEKTWDKLRRASEVVAAGRPGASEDLLETVVGEFTDSLDLSALVRDAVRHRDPDRADRAIDEAIRRVRDAATHAGRLLDGLDAFRLGEPDALQPRALGEKVERFVELVLAAHQRRLLKNEDGTHRFRLPDAWRGGAGLMPSYPSVVFDPEAAREHPNAMVMGFGIEAFDKMIDWARYEASPNAAARLLVDAPEGTEGLVAVFAIVTHDEDERGRLNPQTRHCVVTVTTAGSVTEGFPFELMEGEAIGPSTDAMEPLLDQARRWALTDRSASRHTHRGMADARLEACAWFQSTTRTVRRQDEGERTDG